VLPNVAQITGQRPNTGKKKGDRLVALIVYLSS
jgi:hypothetical protein